MLKEVKRVFKDSTIYGLGSLIPRAASIVLTPIYTTYLTQSDYGVMSFVMVMTSMVGTLMLLGQQGSLVYFYRSTAVHADERRELLFNVLWCVALFGALLLGLGFLIGPERAEQLTGTNTIAFYPYLAIGLLTAYLAIPQALQQAVNRAQGHARTFTLFALGLFALNTAFTLYFVVAQREGALGSLKGHLVATAVLAPIALIVVLRRSRARLRLAALGRSLRYGLPLVPHYFAGWALTFIDRFLLLRLSTTAEVGLYSLAYNFGMALNIVCAAINQAWGPIYYDLADTEDGRRTLPRLTTVYTTAVTAFAIAYTFLGPDLLRLLANERFHAAAPAMPIVAGGYFFFALYMIVSTPIFHARKTSWMPFISISAAALNVAANLVLIPRYGILGAAWATLVAYLFMAIVARILSQRVQRGIYEDRKLVLLVAIYLVSMALSALLVSYKLPILLDLAIKTVLIPANLALIVVLRVARVSELKAVLRRRRAPRKGRGGSGAAADQIAEEARRAEEVSTSTDDLGGSADDLRP